MNLTTPLSSGDVSTISWSTKALPHSFCLSRFFGSTISMYISADNGRSIEDNIYRDLSLVKA